ncbi:MAG: hypothetical protein LBB91_05405 [Clostridiales bacterium]|jgi:hypothetical protein|nr:hypothetical protein [Clostridiales bacterium]
MFTYVYCRSDGEILSVNCCDELPGELERDLNTPEGGFFIDLTGQKPFDTLDVGEIHNGYQADAKKQKLIKRKEAKQEENK